MCRVRGVTGLGSSAAPMPVQGPIGDTNRLHGFARRDWVWAILGPLHPGHSARSDAESGKRQISDAIPSSFVRSVIIMGKLCLG
ncbi:hypothetical protein PgNI_05512 [Pyricularia grisea]|uniref:Uncharacterized protein n=1 Tax=Pyricularia grisea TaxID=148305 RepID=A0A6P8B4W8_PYRGI|nr:hypothetical protein PgNI_05512 [Pyricularia grisea]TLD10347.1 hypothetical protein PgNI_05512 [Pyricularia grisea]